MTTRDKIMKAVKAFNEYNQRKAPTTWDAPLYGRGSLRSLDLVAFLIEVEAQFGDKIKLADYQLKPDEHPFLTLETLNTLVERLCSQTS